MKAGNSCLEVMAAQRNFVFRNFSKMPEQTQVILTHFVEKFNPERPMGALRNFYFRFGGHAPCKWRPKIGKIGQI